MAITLTLAAHNLNDGTTYALIGVPEAEPLGVSATINDNASDGSQTQDNVKTKVPSTIRFRLKVAGANLAGLVTALDNLDTWCRAGGALAWASGATSLLSCTCGASTPPLRTWTVEAATAFWMLVDVSLVRMT